MIGFLAVLVTVLAVAQILAIGWGLNRATTPTPRPTTRQPVEDHRNGMAEIRAIHNAARVEWERKWKQETGETWGTIYTEDIAEYTTALARHHGIRRTEGPDGEVITMHTLGTFGPKPVFGPDPYGNKNQYYGAGDEIDMSISFK